MSYYVGRAAADTLGFITGDVPGAVAADRIYQRYMSKKLTKKWVNEKLVHKVNVQQ